MNNQDSILFHPLKLGKLGLAGRVFKTATSETRASVDGFVTDELLEFYQPMVQAGTPLIITGNLYVTDEGKSTYRMCGVDHRNKIPGLKRWADLAHSNGVALIGQINHCGRQVFAKAMGLKQAVSASDVREKFMGTKPRPLTTEEVRNLATRFAESAEYCAEAGFDGVQIHAGHGYLVNQFLSPYTNRRTDEYGGSRAKRMQFLLEIYRTIRVRLGDDFTIITKIGGADYLPGREALTTDDLVEITRILQEEGLDGVEITVGHYESGFPMIRGRFNEFFRGLMKEGIGHQMPVPQRTATAIFREPMSWIFNQLWKTEEGFNLKYARQFKEKLTIPVICVGGFISRAGMEQAIISGGCDAVSCARAMIADPFLFRNLQNGSKGPQCNFCNGCIGRAGKLPVECYIPEVKKEKDAMLANDN